MGTRPFSSIPADVALASFTKRFWARVDNSGSCWLWTGSITSKGYGHLRFGGRQGQEHMAHRLSYMFCVGEPPGELEVCHRCDTPACVRPDHLFLGSHLENMVDAKTKGRIRSARGEAAVQAKLTTELVLQLRSAYACGLSFNRLSAVVNVSARTVRNVVLGVRWRHVPSTRPSRKNGWRKLTEESVAQIMAAHPALAGAGAARQ